MPSNIDYLSFRLSEEFISGYIDRKVEWGYKDAGGNALGEITFLRTYSRTTGQRNAGMRYADV
jgi:hypothetical protein